MSDGDLLKLSQDFHKKIDDNDVRLQERLNTAFGDFGRQLSDVVKSGHETEFQVQQIMDDRPCIEVKAVKEEVETHLEGHDMTKRDIKGLVLSVLATVLALVLAALILYHWGLPSG